MKKYFLPMLALGALCITSCNDDPLTEGGPGFDLEDGPGYYINATISLPNNGSRSATDETGDSNSNGSSNSGNAGTDDNNTDTEVTGPDIEYGYDYENDVRSMILVITDKNDNYLTHLVINGMSQASTSGQDYTFQITTRIPYGVLQEAYEEGGLFYNITNSTKPMRLYAFCNYTNNLLTQYATYQKKVVETPVADRTKPETKYDDGNQLLLAWRDFHGGVEEKASMAGQTPQSTNSIWSPRSFLMSNYKVYESEFPKDIDEWDQYADDRNPLNLTQENGPIKVERVAARIDFRDASEKGDQNYQIWVKTAMFTDAAQVDAELSGVADHTGEKNLFSVHLSRMVLVNMSKDFYYLRRVSDDGTMTGANLRYAGTETPTNYVVDYNWSVKKDVEGVTPANASTYFNFPLYDENATNDDVIYNNMYGTYGWYISNINKEGDKSSVLNGATDNWESNIGKNQYHIWRYVTENCIPSIDQQKTVQSTGVIFKASIEVGDDINETYEASGDQGETRYVSQAVVNALKTLETHPTTKPTLKNFFDEQGAIQTNGTDTNEALPALYQFHNMFYGGVADIVAAARADGNGGALYFAVDQILKNWYITSNDVVSDPQAGQPKYIFKYYENAPTLGEGNQLQLNVIIADQILNKTAVTDGSYAFNTGDFAIDFKDADAPESLAEFDNSQFIELCPAQDITVFIPTNDDTEGWGYYCYYFYWIRHNDNGLNGKMGPMEFNIVRNNVYKLAVTKINAVGHPRDTTRDPDPVRPEDPDEEPERSIEVEVNVLPWVVRVNNIEF